MVNEWLIESLDGPDGNVIGQFWDDLSDFPILGNREVWEFSNPTNSMHPMHVHLVRFQIVSKTDLATGQPIPLEPWENTTWKDIVRIPANASARIIMDFEDYPGRFPAALPHPRSRGPRDDAAVPGHDQSRELHQ